jgi:5-methylcytosine-specific restriction enzyme B
MTEFDLKTDGGLRAACEAIGRGGQWAAGRSEWIARIAETIEWVRSADKPKRSARDFQERLWERNHIAAVGQGNISVAKALDVADFREWMAGRSIDPLPETSSERQAFLTSLYNDLKERLQPYVAKVPHLKIFRVMTALYPEAMTTIASIGALDTLARAMGNQLALQPAERHVWVRERLDAVLGAAPRDAQALAERIGLPWMLYERFVQADPTEKVNTPDVEPALVPLPAARRRRGLTAIKGLFPGVVSTLQYVRDGTTKAELLDFLRNSSPESKESSLRTAINVLKSELDVITADGDRYVLTERGQDVLESQDANYLADWLLTRILGVDQALVALRDGPLAPTDLTAAIKPMNPGWTTDFAPQAIVTWLRSFGVIETTPQWKHTLTEVGRAWLARVHWKPEPLPSDPTPTPTPAETTTSDGAAVQLPPLAGIIASVQQQGHFPASLVAQLHAGLWSHPRRHFAILSGLSGAGKTLLARSYSKALTAGETDGRLFTLPVQPGWHDPAAIQGYPNPLDKKAYERPAVLEFLMKASGDRKHPYVLVLDEMNLSHPEQYFAPFLSAMETGDAIVLHGEEGMLDGVPPVLEYPDNLAVIGTVNMDETTHGLSDKVLDRAFVIEFWHVDLDTYPRWGKRSLSAASEQQARQVLEALMKALSPARLHFGWRVVDDVLDFLDLATDAGGLPFAEALDAVVYAKILPKLRGDDTVRLREALAGCEKALAAAGLGQSRAKVAELVQDVETTGNARFWR